MIRTSLRPCFAASIALAAALSLPAPAAASQCAEDLVLLEPTNVEVVVTPPQGCLTVDVVASGCGDAIAVRVDNQCAETASIVGGDPACTAETPCEAASGQRVFVNVPETNGHVDVTFTVTVGGDASEVEASFDISQDVDTPGEADDGGCSAAAGAAGTGGAAVVLVAAALLAALPRRRH